MDYQLDLDWNDFLQRYWQKRPVILKRGFKNFIDPISPDELAGLAMENEVDSRLVSHQDGRWQVAHGPFESFDHLSENNWSLLVQAVDHWHEPSAALMRPFRQLPDWRMDDLMISFSVPGGGVGPHLDQYDVFIIQGTGRRRWRVGEKTPLKQHCPHPDLLQVEPFDAIIDEEMEPGDILYIPPGFPHEGYALENALNYSVGFRAPNGRELVSGFADYVLARELGSKRYGDPDVKLREHPAEILPQEVDALRQMMLDLVQQPEHFQHWFGEFISQSRHELDLAPPEPPYQAGEIKPFHLEEVIARMQALMRRNSGLASQVIVLPPFQIDLSRRELSVNDRQIKLTAFEYTIIETLIRNAGKVVSKDSLMLQLYPDAELRESHTIDVLMGRLRKKVQAEYPHEVITTVRGQGYRFDAK